MISQSAKVVVTYYIMYLLYVIQVSCLMFQLWDNNKHEQYVLIEISLLSYQHTAIGCLLANVHTHRCKQNKLGTCHLVGHTPHCRPTAAAQTH